MDDSDVDSVEIPIKRTDLVMFDDSVSPVRAKFIAEINKMDEEMNRFSSDLTRLNAQSSSLHTEMGTASDSSGMQSPSTVQNNWESLANSPLVECEGKNKTLKLQFDVSQFDPNEVTVKIQNDTLVISASHEENCRNSSTLRQYYREFKFPKGINPCTVSSTLSLDGVLTVEAPLPQCPIAKSGSCGRCSPKCKK